MGAVYQEDIRRNAMHVSYDDCHAFMVPYDLLVFAMICLLCFLLQSIVMSFSPGTRTAPVYTVLLPCLFLRYSSPPSITSPFTPIGPPSLQSRDVSSVTSSSTDYVTIRSVTITLLPTPSSAIVCHRRSVFQQGFGRIFI